MKRAALVAIVMCLLAACAASASSSSLESDSRIPAVTPSEPVVDEAALVSSLEGTAHMLWFWAPN